MAKKKSGGVDRRAFLAGIGAAGAATAAAAAATPATAEAAHTQAPTALPPVTQSHAAMVAQIEEAHPGATVDSLHIAAAGSDYMVDVLMALGYTYVAATPGTTFRGLQESVINHAIGKMEWISTAHEEISGSLAHGYAKASGKPMAIMVHNTVGLQHATMAMYNAWADRVPMLVMLGNYADGALRVGGADWDHAATDDAAMVRGYVKYDEQPGSLEHYKESMLRGHGLMMTAPMGPIVMVCDQQLQESEQSRKPQAPMPAFVSAPQPTADPATIATIAKMLVNAQNPVIMADRATRTQAGVLALVALAEALQAPVVDMLGRMNFPTNHYLCGSRPMASEADLILALDVGDLFSVVNALEESITRESKRRIRPDCKVISIDSQLLVGAGNYQDKQRFYQADVPVPADSEATLPYLVEAVKSAMSTARRNDNATREARMRTAFYVKRASDMEQAAIGWDASPISVPRLCMELWKAIKPMGENWAHVSQSGFQSAWQNRLWDFTQHHQFLGGSGAAGIGYIGGAQIGAALAHKEKGDGCLCVSVQGDGDFMMGPGAMWTAAHHKIPLLMVIHNNRAWHQETMSVQIMASRRSRHPERGRIGTVITDPNINYAKLAEGFGVYSEPQITQASDLPAAIARAIKMVKSGEPALLDVVTQPR
jgi:thiamine pyrophosphate-dependent acetolactate synthase large subunit-like protein